MKILYIDMDNTLVDFGAKLDGIDQKLREEVQGSRGRTAGAVRAHAPMAGALDAFAELSTIFDTYIPVHGSLEEPIGLAAQGRVGPFTPRHRRGDPGLQTPDSVPPQEPEQGRLPR